MQTPIDLDSYRSKSSKGAISRRRKRIHDFHMAQAALRQQQGELEESFLANGAETLVCAVSRAQYLLELYAETAEAQEPRRKLLIVSVLDDLYRLCNRAGEQP